MCFFITELKELNTQEIIANNKVIAGLDIGDKTVGISISDRRLKIASGITTIQRNGTSKDLETFKKAIENYDIGAIIFGWPVQMNGLPGAQCEKILNFVTELSEIFKVPFCKWDERCSTCAVDKILIQADMSRKKRKKVIDKSAAIYILQGALDCINKNII